MHRSNRVWFCLVILALLIHTLATLEWNRLDQYYTHLRTAAIIASVEPPPESGIGRSLQQQVHTVHNHASLLLFQNKSLNDAEIKSKQRRSRWPKGKFWRRGDGCKKWGVVRATMATPTSAVQRFAAMDGWCLVVVADRGGSYHLPNAKGSVVFLSEERQEKLARYMAFVKTLPWNYAARKNIGYLFAIANGAEFIWDFDEHNTLDPSQTLERYTQAAASNTTLLVPDTRLRKECGVFNPFPIFRPSEQGTWPRGLPLERVNVPGCKLAPRYYLHEVPSKHVGIVQSLANQNPDRDSFNQLIQQNRITFQGAYEDHPVVVPPNTISPTNSQATLYSRIAMWSLFLPTTVHGHFSDTWRSYITQALATRSDMLVTFAGPFVTRDHQPTNLTLSTDMMCDDLQMHEKLQRLVSYLLTEWRYDSPEPTLEGALERLYLDLYQIGVVKFEDVQLVQLWILALRSVGYKFPTFHSLSSSGRLFPTENQKWKWTRARFDDVVLVGQFNYNSGAEIVIHWVKRWRELFKHIDVRGPFGNATMDALHRSGINAYLTAGERGGLYSPMKTMAESLRMYDNDDAIRGVVVVHDDLLFNVSLLVEQGFPSDDAFIGCVPPDRLAKPYLFLYGNKTLRLENSQVHVPVSDYKRHLYSWSWWDEVIPRATIATLNDSDREKYMDPDDGGMPFYHHAQSDFIYFPTSNRAMTKEYADHADFMFRNRIMLEVATTTIVARLTRRFNLTVTLVVLATDWGTRRNHLMKWMPERVSNWTNYKYGIYHPVKARNMGLAKWDAVFDALVLGTIPVEQLAA